MTRTELLDAKSKYEAAILAVSSGQSYAIAGRSLTRADLSDLQAGLAQINRSLAGGGACKARATWSGVK